MLPKINRLPLRTEFKRLKKEGVMVSGPLFSLLAADSKTEKPPLFAFIVSKKIDKRATARNRVRRLLSEAVWEILPRVRPGAEGVFLTKKSIIGRDLEEIKKNVADVFTNARLKNNE